MNQAMAQLAEKLGIDHAKLPREEMAEAVCEKALKCIETFEGFRTIDALQMEPNVDYVGINLAQLQTDVDAALDSGLLKTDQLIAFCDQATKASQVIMQLYQTLEPCAPHRTIGLTSGAPSIITGGLGRVIDNMLDNRHLFNMGLNKVNRTIRAHLKRREAIKAAEANDVADKSGMHEQIGMGV